MPEVMVLAMRELAETAYNAGVESTNNGLSED